MKRIAVSVAAALLVGIGVSAFADESVRLKEGAGRDVVINNCIACHSTDYIQMDSPFMKRPAWEATVNKMIKVMGAPIRPEDVPIIVEYLTKNYGVE
jgi:mono/diheme cytochrome c family protein